MPRPGPVWHDDVAAVALERLLQDVVQAVGGRIRFLKEVVRDGGVKLDVRWPC